MSNDKAQPIETVSISTALPYPEQAATRVTTDLDWESEGRQITYLRVPSSRNNSAWARQMIPIIQYRNGDGPSMLITGGVHGDEYEGPVALSKLVERLRVDQVRGRLIIIPAMNYPAHLSATRLSPLDGIDLNRCFPGSRTGSVTQMIAHFVDSVILPKVDIVLDFHSGGSSLDFVPSVVMHELDDREQMRKTKNALKAFGAPFGMILKEIDGEGMFDTAAETKGKIFLSTELRGGGTVSTEAVQIADNGIVNLLAHFGVAEIKSSRYTKYRAKQTQILISTPYNDCFLAPSEDGLYEPLVPLGTRVQKDDPVGQVHYVGNLTRRAKVIRAARSGVVAAKRFQGRVEAGDCVAVIGIERPWEE